MYRGSRYLEIERLIQIAAARALAADLLKSRRAA